MPNNICPHCDHECRYYQTYINDMSGNVWHIACYNEMSVERSKAVPAMRLEDWELESRRHEQHDSKAAYDYHIERRI